MPEWMSSQVRHWKEQAAALDCQERKIRHELQKSLEIELPVGVGVLSWVILEPELRGLGSIAQSPALSILGCPEV